MKKVLIIAYYWPPSGGAGVQRWLKLSHYLAEAGVEVYLIAPKPSAASYMTFDETLSQEVNPKIKVHLTPSFEPLNLYKKLVGSKNVPTAGMSNVDTRSWKQRLSLFLRSNLFIPDPRKYWKSYAVKMASELIEKYDIKDVITTSPPHSAQRIGLAIKERYDINWIADLRDLWTGIYYYELLQHSKWSKARDLKLERKVLDTADHVTTVSPMFRKAFLDLSSNLLPERIHSIPNGYDPRDFEGFEHERHKGFHISYTGTISAKYNIEPFLQAVNAFIKEVPDSGLRLNFIGFTDEQIKESISAHKLKDITEYSGYIPHHQAIKKLEEAYALLLVGPLNQERKEGSVPAKVYEYMASGRPIIYIGQVDGFVSELLDHCQAGKAFTEVEQIKEYIHNLHQDFVQGKSDTIPHQNVRSYSRVEQARQFLELLG